MGNRVSSIPSPGIRSINGIEAPSSNLTLVSSNNSISFTPNASNKTIDLQVNTEVVSVPMIENISMPTANQQYNISLPLETKRFSFRLRNNGVLLYSYVSSGAYFTLPPGTVKEETGLSGAFVDIYVKSSTAGNVLELEYWV